MELCSNHILFLDYVSDLQEYLSRESNLTEIQKSIIIHKEIYRTTRTCSAYNNSKNYHIRCQKKCCNKKSCSRPYIITENTCNPSMEFQSEIKVDADSLISQYNLIPKETRTKIKNELSQRTYLRKIDITTVYNVVSKNEWILTRLLKVIDGDTISVACLVGTLPLKISVRIYGIDCPETRRTTTKEITAGKLVGEYVKTLLCDVVRVKFTDVDKWGGRWLGYVEINQKQQSECSCKCGSRGDCLSKHLTDKKYAKSYYGEKKGTWSEKELDFIIKELK